MQSTFYKYSLQTMIVQMTLRTHLFFAFLQKNVRSIKYVIIADYSPDNASVQGFHRLPSIKTFSVDKLYKIYYYMHLLFDACHFARIYIFPGLYLTIIMNINLCLGRNRTISFELLISKTNFLNKYENI